MEKREYEHHLHVRKTYQRYGRTFIGPEFDFICWLRRAEKLVHEIARTDIEPFELVTNTRGLHRYRLTKMGMEILNVCRSYDDEVSAYYEHHRFNPSLTVMLTAVTQWSRELCGYINGRGALNLSEGTVRDILSHFLASIRSECRSQVYKDGLDNYKRNEEKNIASCCDYMAAQFERRAQLLVLRVDLYFRPQFKGWGYTREADAQYGRFLRALREGRIVMDVLGYIGKREDGIDRGIHYHLLIVLDGHKHRDAANLTRIVGEEWVKRCGHADYNDGFDVGEGGAKDRASYFNCYTRADQYHYNCLGLIHPTDSDKLRGLRVAIEYMCKETSQLKPSPPKAIEGFQDMYKQIGKGIRNLRKGIMPKGHSGRGAPRSSGLDTSAIERELLKKP